MSRAFIGKMSNGVWRAAIAKPGYDASDPATKIAQMQWTADIAALRRIASAETTVTGPTVAPGIGDGFGETISITVPAVSSPIILAQCQAVQRWAWLYYVVQNGTITSLSSTDMATGWWFVNNAYPNNVGCFKGPALRITMPNSTTVSVRVNNSGNGTNNKSRVRWALYDAG